MNIYQILGALAAGLAALNAFLNALPADTIPTGVIIAIGASNALVAAVIVYLSKPATMAQKLYRNFRPEYMKAAKQ
jgi:hypothetical protein